MWPRLCAWRRQHHETGDSLLFWGGDSGVPDHRRAGPIARTGSTHWRGLGRAVPRDHRTIAAREAGTARDRVCGKFGGRSGIRVPRHPHDGRVDPSGLPGAILSIPLESAPERVERGGYEVLRDERGWFGTALCVQRRDRAVTAHPAERHRRRRPDSALLYRARVQPRRRRGDLRQCQRHQRRHAAHD